MYLIISGILMGLAMLTKTQALFVFPIIGLSILIDTLLHNNDKNFINFSKRIVVPVLVLIALTIVTYFALFPAMWINPVKVIQKVFGEAIYVAEVGRSIKNVRPFYHYLLLLPRIISYPIILLFFTSVGYIFIRRIKISKEKFIQLIYMILFVILYFIEISIVKQKIDRYLLPLFPFIFIICGYILSQIKRFNLAIFTLVVTMVITLIYYAPNYALVGCNHPSCNTHGYLYKDVADYINENTPIDTPTAVTVAIPYALKPFVKGNVYGHEDPIPDHINVDYLITNDYLIEDRGVPDALSHCKFCHKISFHNITFWDIYCCR